jgi:hypothetical protein
MRNVSRVFTAAALIAATASCGDVVRSSRAPVILVVDSLAGIKGAVTAGTPSSTLSSDVFTLVTSGGVCTTVAPCPTIFSDAGQVTMHIVLKDIGQPGTTVDPSTNNQVTVTRLHVSYRRTDGRNQEGVDVPYGFDTASTATMSGTATTTFGFPLVRIQAKEEAPLMALRTNGQVISVIADVTFYGQDVVGNAVTASGSINIDFANFGD